VADLMQQMIALTLLGIVILDQVKNAMTAP
jgi:hypothetical protein